MDQIIKLHFQRNIYQNRFDFWLVEESRGSEELSFGKPVIMEKMDAGSSPPHPTFCLRNNEAQDLIDSLWNQGFRPSSIPEIGNIESQQRHIGDLREIVFQLLKKVR